MWFTYIKEDQERRRMYFIVLFFASFSSFLREWEPWGPSGGFPCPPSQQFRTSREESWSAHTESCLLWAECQSLPQGTAPGWERRCRPAVCALSVSCNLAPLCLAGFSRLPLANPHAHTPCPVIHWSGSAQTTTLSPARPLSSLLSTVCTLRRFLSVTLMLPCPCEFECWLFSAVSYLMKNVSWSLYCFPRYPSPPPPSFFPPVSVLTWIQSSSL